jgi:hypothetical protein
LFKYFEHKLFYKPLNYAEIRERGLYLWNHGFEKGQHPFAAFDQIQRVSWRRIGRMIRLELIVPWFERPAVLLIHENECRRLIPFFTTEPMRQSRFFKVINEAVDGLRSGES